MSNLSVKMSAKVNGVADIIGRVNDFFNPKASNPSPLGKATAAAARELYLNMQRLVPVNTDGTAKDPGLLQRSVYRYWNPKLSPNGNKIAYEVGVNLTKAPHFHLAEHGHNFYANYMPFQAYSFFPKQLYKEGKRKNGTEFTKGGFRSRRKTSGLPLGPVKDKAKARPYLEQSFGPEMLNLAAKIVKEVYIEQFNKAMG